MDEKYNTIIDDVTGEFIRATSLNGPFNTAHEAWAVIYEEVDELWDEVKKKRSQRDNDRMRDEAIQIAAMAIRLIYDLCSERPWLFDSSMASVATETD